jgi:hypothetical protein
LRANFPAIPRPQCRKFLPEEIDGAHMHDAESNRGERPMPLLKPPEPQIPMRKFYVRIEEPLARTMEHAESLGTDNLDHVVGQVLQFIFKSESQFNRTRRTHVRPTAQTCNER